MTTPMIDYAVLCQAIADWRAGHAPAPAHYAADVAPAESADEYEEYVEEEPPAEEHTVIYNLPIIPMDEDG